MDEKYWQSRWTREQVRALLLEQHNAFLQRETGIERAKLADVLRAAQLPHAVIISGLRRVGKSTLLAQVARKIGPDQFYYLNFEDDRFLGFEAEDTNYLYGLLVELFGERKTFIVDEIQNVRAWEHFVRRFIDNGFKFYITGSNASLLSRELGSRLTGRYVPIELYPFSFAEFLRFSEAPPVDLARMTTVDSARLQGYLRDYLLRGGLPEALKYPELPLTRTLYDDVLYRDIATRYNIEEVRALKELAFYLISNPASLVSYNRLKDQLRLGSVNTVKNYVEYLENSWLIFTLNVYDFSVRRQQIAAKKVYSIDPGLTNAVGFSFSPNTGKLLETAVFLALRRRTSEVYYYVTSSGSEIDFFLPEPSLLVQVTQSLNYAGTREREMRALAEAAGALGTQEAMILTETGEDDIQIGETVVKVRGVAEWLLERELV
jgi:uncharacterized protein